MSMTPLDAKVLEFVRDMDAMAAAYQHQAMDVKDENDAVLARTGQEPSEKIQNDSDAELFSWLLDMSTYFKDIIRLVPAGNLPLPVGAVTSMVSVIQNTYDNEKSFDAESAKTSAYGRALDGLVDVGIISR